MNLKWLKKSVILEKHEKSALMQKLKKTGKTELTNEYLHTVNMYLQTKVQSKTV